MSSSFTILDVSQAAYDEISKALKKAGYSVERNGEINMEGIHLKQKELRAGEVRRLDRAKHLNVVGAPSELHAYCRDRCEMKHKDPSRNPCSGLCLLKPEEHHGSL